MTFSLPKRCLLEEKKGNSYYKIINERKGLIRNHKCVHLLNNSY